jgi:tRNA(Arg) A34 adenosine deaminase TadA
VDLDGAWRRALELAWDGYLTGTTPVGAVVVDRVGAVAAEGRGRRHGREGDTRQLAYCHIAHAEINALALLPPTRHYEDHILLTTLEPCCMCLGATIQATVMQLRYAGRDPYGGTAHLVIDTPQARRRALTITGPLPDVRGRFAELLHVRWLLDFGAATPVLDEQRRGIPGIYTAAVRATTKRLFDRLRHESVHLEEAMEAARGVLS